MSQPENVAAATRRTESVITTALENWKNGLDSMTAQLRTLSTMTALPQVSATDAVERQFAFIKQVVDINYEYARQLAEAANTLTGATRQQMEAANAAMLQQVERVSEVARTSIDSLEQSAREATEQIEQAQRDQVDAVQAMHPGQAGQTEPAEAPATVDLNAVTDEAVQRG